MYLFGVLFNGVAVLQSVEEVTSLLHVYTALPPAVWLIVLTQSLNGFLYAYVMRYASNVSQASLLLLLLSRFAWNIPSSMPLLFPKPNRDSCRKK
jgi:hypothetical protein